MKVCLAGQGAFGIKHLEAIANIDGMEVVTLSGGRPAGTEEVAEVVCPRSPAMCLWP